jgi:ketosteroid isomerase-like protein
MTTGCERRQLSGLGLVVCGCFAGLVLVTGCSQAPPPVDTKGAEDAVRAADAAAMKAAQTLDVDGTVAYYTADAMVMPPNMKAVTGQKPVHDAWAAMLVPGAKISWAANKVESSASGDLVYDQGTYSVTVPGPDGKWVSDDGKYLGVWKKQPDGSWKEVEDIWNSDLPVAAAAPVAVKKGK